MTTGARLKNPSWVWLALKLVFNTTTIALAGIWIGHHYGYKDGFHRGVIVTTELVEFFAQKIESEKSIKLPQYRITDMQI